jgi:hypothetical protein
MIAIGSDLEPLGIPLPDYYYALFFSYPMFLLSPLFPACLPLSQSTNAINPISFVTTTAAMVQLKKEDATIRTWPKRHHWKEIVLMLICVYKKLILCERTLILVHLGLLPLRLKSYLVKSCV